MIQNLVYEGTWLLDIHKNHNNNDNSVVSLARTSQEDFNKEKSPYVASNLLVMDEVTAHQQVRQFLYINYLQMSKFSLITPMSWGMPKTVLPDMQCFKITTQLKKSTSFGKIKQSFEDLRQMSKEY